MQATPLKETDVEDMFALDVQVITDVTANGAATRCSTDNGCAATCASSCASRG
jgi:FxLD family lantipeptide